MLILFEKIVAKNLKKASIKNVASIVGSVYEDKPYHLKETNYSPIYQ